MYGIFLLAGILSAVLLGERLCKERGLDQNIYWKTVFHVLVLGVIGARVYHVLHRLPYFLSHPAEIFVVWTGGLGIWGAIIGGIFGFYIALRIRSDKFNYADILAVGVPLAQSIGRWGNYFNREVFDIPTSLSWGIYIPRELRPSHLIYYDRFHPLFLYESVLCFLLFVFLYRVFKQRGLFGKDFADGIIAALYLAGYSVIRFFLEFLRPSPWSIGDMPLASLISVITLILSAVFISIRFRRSGKVPGRDLM